MSASQTLIPFWMEIADRAVHDQARQHANDEALAALVEQYATTLYRVAFSVMRNPSDAEDAVQEAFLRVLRHRDSLDRSARPSRLAHPHRVEHRAGPQAPRQDPS